MVHGVGRTLMQSDIVAGNIGVNTELVQVDIMVDGPDSEIEKVFELNHQN